MAAVHPFQAVIPPAAVAADVSALPYDVMSAEEAARMAAGRPLSFLWVSRAEIELPADTDPHSETVYRQAADNYRRLTAAAPLVRDAVPTYYVYSLERLGHRQTGIAAALTVDDYEQDVIRKHEKTRPDKVEDRTHHILALRAHTGPVFLAYRDSREIDAIVAATMTGAPAAAFRADDGVAHSVWRVAARDTGALRAAFARVAHLYIADGHHRAASAGQVRAQCRGANAQHRGDEAYNRFLGVVFPASQLRILPYNRTVKGLNGHSPESLLAGVRRHFTVGETTEPTPDRPGCVRMRLGGRWWALAYASNPAAIASPVDRLDVSLLQDLVLGPLLGIADPRTSTRIEFVGGIRGTAELERRVAQGNADVAFSMFPTTVQQLMEISDAGQIMPPKSTWFEPKLRDGLLIHDF